VLTAHWVWRAIQATVTATALTLVGSTAFAGPPEGAPVTVTPGGPLLAGDDNTVTLTLDSAGHAGNLDEDSVQAVTQAAARFSADDPATERPVQHQTAPGSGTASEPEASDDDTASEGECAWRDASRTPSGATAWGGNDPNAGTLVVSICNGPTRYVFVPDAAPVAGAAAAPPPPPPDPAVLALQAYGELTLPKPVAKRSPDENNSDPQYGGLPYTWVQLWTWVWAQEWQPHARTVELRGVSAMVTATPTSLVFDPGDGSAPTTCQGQGRPWTTADGNSSPTAGGCGYMYRAVTPTGPLTATTSIEWSVVWTSNVGAGGVFPPMTTQATSSFLVEQIQVVTR
jgi:hypothetical protein